MDFLSERTKKLTNAQLCAVFDEYSELDTTGVLEQGLAREIEQEYKTFYSISGCVLEEVRRALFYEMGRRFYLRHRQPF